MADDAIIFVVVIVGVWALLVWLAWIPALCCRHLVGLGSSDDSIYLMLLVSQMISLIFLMTLQFEWVTFRANVDTAVIVWISVAVTLTLSCLLSCLFHRLLLIILVTLVGVVGSFVVYPHGGAVASILIALMTLTLLVFIGYNAWNAYILMVINSVCSSAVVVLAYSIVFVDDRTESISADPWLLVMLTVVLSGFRVVVMVGLCCSYHFSPRGPNDNELEFARNVQTPLIHSTRSKQILQYPQEKRGCCGWRYGLPTSEVEIA